ncbi:MAG: hypothetical protein NTV63_00680 [Candidatus Woesearchaeota archaeon]|nr:hypothetical protein [Candidatus Woesearchaeota archaeon]
MGDSELERIRQEKLRRYREQESSEDSSEDEARLQQEIGMLEQAVKARLTKEALARYANIKIAHPELALNLLLILGRAVQGNQVDFISDSQLREILQQIQAAGKKDFSIMSKQK